MSCQYGYKDCCNFCKKCSLCFSEGQFYESNKKPVKIRQAKETKRAGSKFEANNSNINNKVLIGSVPTPNSGAGYIKGDEQIKGYVRITEELKEQNAKTSRGLKTFTIHKEWLDKLRTESIAANQEFWYLKFVFGQEDVLLNDYYIVIENDMLMSIVKSLWEDRKTATLAQERIDLAERRKETIEAENIFLKAKVAELEAELKLLRKKV